MLVEYIDGHRDRFGVEPIWGTVLCVLGSLEHSPDSDFVTVPGAEFNAVDELAPAAVAKVIQPACDRAGQHPVASVFQQRRIDVDQSDTVPAEWKRALQRRDRPRARPHGHLM